MIHPEKRHFIIVAKTLGIQVLLFVGILFTVWGSQKLYTLIDPVKFPVYQAEIKDNMTDQEKGAALLSALTHRMDAELSSTFGWTANDILFNRWIMDNRAYRQFGTYVATKMLFDHYSTVIAKLGNNDRENDLLYNARLNYFAISPQRWGMLFIPSAEGSFKKALSMTEQYKKDLLAGKAVYNCRTDGRVQLPHRRHLFRLQSHSGRNGVSAIALGLLNDSQGPAPSTRWTTASMKRRASSWWVRDYLKTMYELLPRNRPPRTTEQNMAEGHALHGPHLQLRSPCTSLSSFKLGRSSSFPTCSLPATDSPTSATALRI